MYGAEQVRRYPWRLSRLTRFYPRYPRRSAVGWQPFVHHAGIPPSRARDRRWEPTMQGIREAPIDVASAPSPMHRRDDLLAALCLR
jgi:hypothetical protein